LTDYIAKQTGTWVESEAVRLHLKAAGTVPSRPQHTAGSPDSEYAIKKGGRRSAKRTEAGRRLLLR